MGSFLSGWYGRRTSRATTDDYLALDVRYLVRSSALKPGSRLTVTWTRRGEAEVSAPVTVGARGISIGGYCVRLEWMRCNLGGARVWFLCPRCGRRCCLLYRGIGFACRDCLGLAYSVEREGRYDRAERRAWKIIRRAKFDWSRKDCKPKWMRWKTYRRQNEAGETAADFIGVRTDRLIELIRHDDAVST